MKASSLILTADELRNAMAGKLVEIARKVNPQPGIHVSMPPARLYEGYLNRWGCSKDAESIRCPFAVGDTLYVRESFSLRYGNVWCYNADNREVNRWEDDEWMECFNEWQEKDPPENISASRMPEWASRLTLRITFVRAEKREAAWYWIVGVEVAKVSPEIQP